MTAPHRPEEHASADLPAAVPAALSSARHPDRSEAPAERTTATTEYDAASVPRQSRAGRRQLAALRDSLSERDWDVLRRVAAHRYLTTRHLEGFCFDGHATALTGARVCRRVLRRLETLRTLTHLERRIGGVRAGSASYVWQLGPVGDRLLREADSQPRTRRYEPTRLFLDHCLAVADVHLALVQAQRGRLIELETVQTEPDCWRSYTGLGGAALSLRPDLYVATVDPQDPEYLNTWFLEIDRGTEHPKRLLTTCARYEDYRRSGQEQAELGGFPLVVWVMPDDAQAERLTQLIAADPQLDARLFRITTAAGLVDLIRGGVQ